MRLNHLRVWHRGRATTAGALLSLGMIANPAWSASGDPLSNEIQVNSYTPGAQTSVDVATGAADGRFTAVWIGAGNISPSMSDHNVYGQRFTAAGARLGSEFVVNELTTGREDAPKLAMDAAGNFTVVWLRHSDQSSGSYSSVYMRRFAPDGTPLSGDVAVSDVAAAGYDELSPQIAMRPDGSFVVAWSMRQRVVQAPDQNYVVSATAKYARRFAASGSPLSASIEVAPPASDEALTIPIDLFEYGPYLSLYFSSQGPSTPALAVTSDGGFVVGWSGGNGLVAELGFYDVGLPVLLGVSSVYAQRFAASGAASGSRILVDAELTKASIDSNPPAIAALPDGGFVIGYALVDAWSLGNSKRGWYARRYNNRGGRVGLRITADRDAGLSSPYQGAGPALASGSAGDFVMAWPNATNGDIVARTYGADGRPHSDAFIANQLTLGPQDYPSLAVQPGGGFIAGWQTLNVDGSSYSVAARRFDGP